MTSPHRKRLIGGERSRALTETGVGVEASVSSLGSMLADGLLAIAALLAMEPLTAVTHRRVMHGRGMVWHASHHRRRQPDDGRFERNDLFPVVFATVTIVVMAIGTAVPALHPLVPVAVGVTAYGVGYLFVHELYIHRRWSRFGLRFAPLDRLVDAHALHHRFGAEPYGFLLPVVPARIRARVATSSPATARERPAPEP
jgi:beta-carotene 3-hydroxylase